MVSTSCLAVRDWLSQPEAGDLPPALAAHVQSCARCRGALLVLSAALLGVARSGREIDCDACQRDLAGFVDLEREVSAQAAAQEYPDVWWHLWTCAECAEVAALMRDLLEAEPPERPVSLQLPPRRIQMPRMLMMRVLPSQQERTSRGADDPTVLADALLDDLALTLTVRRTSADDWHATALVDPPQPGVVRLTLGAALFHAALDATGQAEIAGIPAALLSDPTGPDLLIELLVV